MTATATATITYRKAKSGEWVAFGPADALRVGPVRVSKKSGETKSETVSRLGKPFSVDGRQMVYGYLAPASSSRGFNSDGARGRGRHCPTGGNCSSFGSGRSCGAHDCDGY